MSKKAVDVVVLPDEAMMGRAIEANAELVKKIGEKIVLNKKDCLPHISFVMGCIYEGDIAIIDEILQSVAKECPLSDLVVLGVSISKNATGEKVSAFEVEKTEGLQLLHEMIMRRLTPYLSYDVSAGMVCDDEVSETTLSWIKNYRQKSSFDNFFPHITLGYGEANSSQPFPIKFTASRLALCHLGNHCTCRKILASVEL